MTKTQKLKALIIEKGLTQGKLAKVLNLNSGTLSRKINNQTPFTVEEAKAIAETLSLTGEEATEIFFA